LCSPRRHKAAGISPVVAEIIIVATAITIAIAASAWVLGVWNWSTRPEVYYHYILTIPRPGESYYQPIPGIANITVWSTPGDPSRVYVRVTATKNLAYIHVKATITNSTGQPPAHVGETWATVEWEDDAVPDGWYSEQYWSPVEASEYPVHVEFHIFLREGG